MKSNGVFGIFVRKCVRAICSVGSGMKTASVESFSEIRDSSVLLIRILKNLDVEILSYVVQKYSRNFPMVLRKVAHVKVINSFV